MNTAADRFANAPSLPFDMSRDWFQAARCNLRNNGLLFLIWALAVLVLRWQLDFLEGGVIIFLSYFTDSLLFAWLFLTIDAHSADAPWPVVKKSWQALQGRKWAVMKAGWWGLPAALISFLFFGLGPGYVSSLVVVLGNSTLGIVSLVLLTLAGGYLTFLAMMWPVLASIQIARDQQATFKSSGLWSFRAVRSGWRPLLVVFVSFVVACFLAGIAVVEVFGHLPVGEMDKATMQWWHYWLAWPGLLAAMVVFLALLHPMGISLLGAADADLSDEVFDDSSKDEAGSDFVARVLDRLGFAVRSLAALSFILMVLQTISLDSLMQGIGMLVAAYFWGGMFYSSARAWRENRGRFARYRWLWVPLIIVSPILVLTVFAILGAQ